MNWTKIRQLYGLKRPFNFNVALPFLVSTGLLVLICLWCAFWLLDNDRTVLHGLTLGTGRFYFFVYIACLLAIAAVFSKTPKLSYAILIWCTIELSLALGSLVLATHSGVVSLCPPNKVVTTPWNDAFIYHPLLQTVPRPNWNFTDHLDVEDMDSEAKAAGVDLQALQGQELTFVHNSLGFRGKELTEADLAKDLIFVYGGSTTYDIGVTQGQTWVEDLQADLKSKYTILNLGVPGHSTTEHLIQTAFYQDIVSRKPVCAVYYVGANDVNNAHIKRLDSAYADYHLLLIAWRKPVLSLANYSPLAFLANALALSRFDTVPQHRRIFGGEPVAGNDEHLEAIFREHIKTIAAINEARGIKTIFIGQIINRSWRDAPDDWMPLVKAGDAVRLLERLKAVLKGTAASIGAKYIDPGINSFLGSDFVDDAHFAPRGSRKFASLISGDVGDYCR